MMRRMILATVTFGFVFLLFACGPGQTAVNSVHLDCTPDLHVGMYGNYTIVIEPQDADDMGYTITIDDFTIINFTTTSEFAGEYEAFSVGTTTISVTTDDGNHQDLCIVVVENP